MLLAVANNNQRALRNLLLQLTRQWRPGDDEFDSRCLERAKKLGERTTEGGAVADLLDHFASSCSQPMRGEESPVKAAQALQFGAEVKVSDISRVSRGLGGCTERALNCQSPGPGPFFGNSFKCCRISLETYASTPNRH